MHPPFVSQVDPAASLSTLHQASVNGGVSWTVAGPSTAAWVTVNRAIYVPVRLATPFRFTQFFWMNGTVVGAPDVDAGIYHANGSRIISTGLTTHVTSNVIQLVNVTDTTLLPGLYYLAIVLNGSSGLFRQSLGGARARILGVVEEGSASPLPAVMTPTASTQQYMPLFGVTALASV